MGLDIVSKVISCGHNGGNLTGRMLVRNRFLTSFPAVPLGAGRDRETERGREREGRGGGNGKSLQSERDWFDLTHLPPSPALGCTQQMLVEAESRDAHVGGVK